MVECILVMIILIIFLVLTYYLEKRNKLLENEYRRILNLLKDTSFKMVSDCYPKEEERSNLYYKLFEKDSYIKRLLKVWIPISEIFKELEWEEIRKDREELMKEHRKILGK